MKIRDVLDLVRVGNIPKNLLWFFVGAAPALAAGLLEPIGLLLALISFNLCWFFIYTLNDCRDYKDDKKHKRKSLRPIASGRISKDAAEKMVPAFAVASAIFALLVSPFFLIVILSMLLVGITYNSKRFGGRSKPYFAAPLLWVMEFLKLLAGATYVAVSVPIAPWVLLLGLPSFYIFAYQFYWGDSGRFPVAKWGRLVFLFLSTVFISLWLIPKLMDWRVITLIVVWLSVVLAGLIESGRDGFGLLMKLCNYFIYISLGFIILISLL